jgi:uncharacterized membrane protein
MVTAHKVYLREPVQLVSTDRTVVSLPVDRPVTVLWDEEKLEADESENNGLSPEKREALRQLLEDMNNRGKMELTDEDKEAYEAWDRGDYRLTFEERLT